MGLARNSMSALPQVPILNYSPIAGTYALRPLEQDRRITILSGSVRSGKTWCLHPKIIRACNYPIGGRRLITGVSKQSIYNNVLRDLFNFVDECEFSSEQAKGNQEVRIQSILPFFDRMPQVKVEKDSRYAVEQNIPLHLGADRKATGYYSAVYSPRSGQSILCSWISYSKVMTKENGEVNIVFIPTAASAS